MKFSDNIYLIMKYMSNNIYSVVHFELSVILSICVLHSAIFNIFSSLKVEIVCIVSFTVYQVINFKIGYINNIIFKHFILFTMLTLPRWINHSLPGLKKYVSHCQRFRGSHF